MADTEEMRKARLLKQSIIQSIEDYQAVGIINNSINCKIYTSQELHNMTLRQLQKLAKDRCLHYM